MHSLKKSEFKQSLALYPVSLPEDMALMPSVLGGYLNRIEQNFDDFQGTWTSDSNIAWECQGSLQL